jgi:hypothetical protein
MKQPSLNRLFSVMKPGESVIAIAKNANAISAEFARLKPLLFNQCSVLVVGRLTDSDADQCIKAWIVTRRA